MRSEVQKCFQALQTQQRRSRNRKTPMQNLRYTSESDFVFRTRKLKSLSICDVLIFEFHLQMDAHDEKSKKIWLRCDQCDYKSYLSRSIRKHMKKHSVEIASNEKYPCKDCSQVFNSNSSRTAHEKSKHSNIEHVCDCGKVFKSYMSHYLHKKNYHTDLKLKCESCVKVFPSKEKLREHFELQHAPKSPCEICGKMVGPGKALRVHKHSAHSKQVQCEYEGCGKILSRKRTYELHVKVFHEPQGIHNCPICDTKFSSEYRLKIHISRQHKTEKKPCQVPGCSHSTFRTNYLIMHYKNHKNISEEEKEKLIRELKSK